MQQLRLRLLLVGLRRLQQQNSSAGTVGTACAVGPTCKDLNVSCQLTPEAAIRAAGTSLNGLTVVVGGSGCLLIPYAGSNVSFRSPITSLVMNSYYQMLVVTEDTLFPTPNRQA